MPDAPSVELQQAWSWICPTCKQLNYVRGNTCTDAEILAEAREALGPGDLVLQPLQVFCCKCEQRFHTKEAHDEH